MADGKERAEWKRQAHAMALFANANRSEGQSAFTADDFNLPAKKRRTVRRGKIGELKVFLTEAQKRKAGLIDGGQ
jgi:hypothetical protein